MSTEPATALYNYFLEEIGKQYNPEKIKDGCFGAMMDIESVLVEDYLNR